MTVSGTGKPWSLRWDKDKIMVSPYFYKIGVLTMGSTLHRVLHGKQNFDEMTEEDVVKLGYVILLFVDLIKLKETGKLTIVKS